MKKARAAPEAPPAAAAPGRWPEALAGLLALAAAAVQLRALARLRQLPSPLFGGDYSYQMGCIRSILASGNPMASCSCSGALPGYLPLYGTIAAGIVKVTGMSVLDSMTLLSVLGHAASTLAVFFVVSRALGRPAGLAIACLWTVLYVNPVFKYTEFTAQVLVPFYFDALLRFARSPRRSHAVYLGLVLAVLGYAHPVAFVAGVAIALGSAAAAVFLPGAEGVRVRAAAIARGLAIAMAGAALAIGYWYRPLFVHHGRTSLHYAEWNGGVALRTLAQRLGLAGEVLASMVRFDDGARGALNALFLAAVLLCLMPGTRRRFAPVLIVAAVTLAWMFHYFLTMPLLHTHFVPAYVRSMMWAFAMPLVAGITASALFERVTGGPVLRAALAAMVAVTIGALASLSGALSTRPDLVAAREPIAPNYLALQKWVLYHTRPDDVVLSTNELSFAWSSLTGRKTLVTRRAQNDAFLDLDVRNRDAALILYGNDDARRRELLDRWSVDYVLWTPDWRDSEYRTEASGNLSAVDPLMVFYDPEVEAELRRAGIATLTTESWVDPSLNDPKIPKFLLTYVLPDNYQPREEPWRVELDRHLEKVWSWSLNGVENAAVYRVRPRP